MTSSADYFYSLHSIIFADRVPPPSEPRLSASPAREFGGRGHVRRFDRRLAPARFGRVSPLRNSPGVTARMLAAYRSSKQRRGGGGFRVAITCLFSINAGGRAAAGRPPRRVRSRGPAAPAPGAAAALPLASEHRSGLGLAFTGRASTKVSVRDHGDAICDPLVDIGDAGGAGLFELYRSVI